jgi:Flp pilus assembly protein TadB
MLISTIVFLFFLFLTYAGFLVASRKSDARQARLAQRVAEALGETTELSLEDAIRITRDASISSNPTLNRLLSSLNVINKIDEMIRQADLQISVSRLLAFCLCAAIMAGLAAYTVM